MFKVLENHIYFTRGDKVILKFSVENYQFKNGDTVRFKVYGQNFLDKPPIFSKIINVDGSDENEISIELTSQDTKIGKMLNTPKDYWYEIELNGETTVLGFDKNGPKILTLYPEGADINE